MCHRHLVRALGLNVTWLLALVASALARSLRRAVTAQVSNLSTVIAFLALGAVSGHVSIATARVTSLSALTTTEASATAAVSTTLIVATTVATGLRAVAGNVSDLGALVALLRSTARRESTTTSSALRCGVAAVTGDVTWLAALVASLVLGTLWAFAAHVSLATAVVALGRATAWAVTGLALVSKSYAALSMVSRMLPPHTW